ncbi:Pectate disaccharide-lyase precursor [Raoultella ornithinolytica]|nr:Pectate disaccharide-lyase precursor [Raoultella ornithinolytica]
MSGEASLLVNQLDVNFSSNVLPEKIGVNDVTIAGKKLAPQDTANLQAPSPLRAAAEK